MVKVKVTLMGMKFEKIINKINMAIVNTTAAREYMTNCERGIRTIKESTRCTVSELRRAEIKVLQKEVIIHLIYSVVMWINGGPNENGISQVYSPREIVT